MMWLLHPRRVYMLTVWNWHSWDPRIQLGVHWKFPPDCRK